MARADGKLFKKVIAPMTVSRTLAVLACLQPPNDARLVEREFSRTVDALTPLSFAVPI